MLIEVNEIRFYLDPQDEELGAIHSQMIEDFKNEEKLDYFKQLLVANASTAFSIYHQSSQK